LKHLAKLKSEKKIIELSQYSLEDNEILHPVSSNYPASNLILKELENKAEKYSCRFQTMQGDIFAQPF